MVKVLCTPARGGGSLWTGSNNSENAFPRGIFWPNLVPIKTTLNIRVSERKTEKKKKKKNVVNRWNINFQLWVIKQTFRYCISRNFHEVFIFVNFANWITNTKIKTRERYCFHSSMIKFVPLSWKRNTTSVDAKLLNLEDLSRHAMTISTCTQDNISQQISLNPAMLLENIHLFNDMIYSWLVSCKKQALWHF